MVATGTAMLASAGIGAATSILGGLLGKSAAQKAADAQKQAADAAGQKVEGAVRDSNPQIINGAANASDMALRAGGAVLDASKEAGAGLNDATAKANAFLDPFAKTGVDATAQIDKGLQVGGDFNRDPTMGDIMIDPGFQFRLEQGQKALARSSAARGGAVSGEALKALDTFTQADSSQEFANAFARYNTNKQNRFANLTSAANMGQAAVGKQGDNLTGAARDIGSWDLDAKKTNLQANEFAGGETYDAAKVTAGNTIRGAEVAGDYLTQKGNAQAAGDVGGANALINGFSSATNGISSAVLLNALLKNPATTSRPMGPQQDPTTYLATVR